MSVISLEHRRAQRYFQATGRMDYFELPPDQRKVAGGRHPENLLDPAWMAANMRPKRKYTRAQRTDTQCTAAQVLLYTPPIPHTQPMGIKYIEEHIYNPTHSEEGCDAERERPYWMNKLVMETRAEREAMGITPKDYGKRWRCSFWHEIGEKPKCGPGDHDKAEQFWYRIRQALDRGGWTPSEQNRLRSLEKIWRDRKDGKDQRFEIVGNYHGTPNERDRRAIRDRRTLAGMDDIINQYRGKGRV